MNNERRQRRFDGVLQAYIFIFSFLAIWLIALPDANTWRPWGYAVGLATQPAWILATLRARQHGMLALSLLYVVIWIEGIRNHLL